MRSGRDTRRFFRLLSENEALPSLIRICCILIRVEQMIWYVEQKVIAGHCVIVEYKCVPDEAAKHVIFQSHNFSVISL